MIRDILLCLIVGYVFGCFQTGYIYGRFNGIDIREFGSGNAGTTNTLRVLGKKAGYITYLGDAFKAIFAILLVKYIIYGQFLTPAMDFHLLLAYTGFGVALGHNYPFYLNFKGGKGIATTSGVMIGVLLFYPGEWHLFAISVVFCAMAWMRHRENIKRLLNGTENRFDRKKKR